MRGVNKTPSIVVTPYQNRSMVTCARKRFVLARPEYGSSKITVLSKVSGQRVLFGKDRGRIERRRKKRHTRKGSLPRPRPPPAARPASLPPMTALQSPSLGHPPKNSKPFDKQAVRPHHPKPTAPKTPTDPKTPPSSHSQVAEKKSASKVSHVICKFYKAGNCSAGTSCQFSHTLPELGQGKPVCQWFVKGNCRFAHKCALAHILPGQPMAMDRKNKRAAQAAAREAAAASASGQTDAPFPASPPPELTLELVPDHHQFHSSATKIVIDEPSNSMESLSSPEVVHRSRQRLGSPRTLLGDLDLETSNQSDDLQFGLPDDFTGSEHSPVHFGSALSPSARHSGFPGSYATHHLHSDHYNNLRSARLSPISQHNGISSEYHQTPTSVERARHWPRDQSPTPFGTGSPFSAPGSRSVFLPRIGSFGSEDGYPRSAPSIATSPRHVGHMMGVHHPNGEDPGVEVDGEEDVTELLPSSLHSLLTPAERHRQHIRKHAPHTLYSRSVPMEEMIGGKQLKKQIEPSALRNGMALDQHSFAVSTEPRFTHSPFNESVNTSYQPENATMRPQPNTYLSSSYIPPPTPFGTWEYSQGGQEPNGSPRGKLPTPISVMQQKEMNGGAFGHAPGTSLPQGLAAGLSRLHFQPPVPTGLTPCGSPSGGGGAGMNLRDQPLSPPRSPPPSSFNHKLIVPPISSPFSQRLPGLNFGSTTVANSSPLSRNVSCSPHLANHIPDDDDTPFRLEM